MTAPIVRDASDPRPQRRVYTAEFKVEAVRLAQERGNLSQTARDLGLGESILVRWKRELAERPNNSFPGHGNPKDPELAEALRQNARLKEENEILKKAVGIFTAHPR